jgi:pyruvate dehydrogenase E2 component (dihydrolipoamide acetyltransferase)
MPKAGITVESCIIGKWEKKKGDRVNVGDILFSYETDKASFECESTAAGEILEIFYSEGEEVPVLVNVCAIGEPGDDISSLRPDGSAAPAQAPEEKTAEPAAAEAVSTKPAAAEPAKAETTAAGISPRAKNLAESAGVDAQKAQGTGPYGRVIERDVRVLIADTSAKAEVISAKAAEPVAAAPAIAAAAAQENEYTDVKFTGIRRVIASSMMASLQNSAQLTNHHSFDATQIMAYRKSLKENAETLGLPNITLNDIVLYAVSRTLLNHPDLNAHMLDGAIRRFKDVHLGIAVDTPRGLMVPTIMFANRKSLAEIAKEAKELAKMAQAGTISPDLLKNGTFTVSNLGSLGVEMFTPVINPPQTGILGVCGIVNRVREKSGAISVYPAMGLSLTYDHRAVDGAPASRFAQELAKNLENITLLLAK